MSEKDLQNKIEITKQNIGSEWKKWDLQVQTILDDNYVSIDSYWDNLKLNFPIKCQTLIDKIGSEELVKKYDSKAYLFTDATVDVKIKAKNYAKLFLNYLDIFIEDVGAVCLTDHNYDHEYLLDALMNESKKTKVKIIAGTEINVQGVHMLVLLNEIPYDKQTYSEGIKVLLSKLEIDNKKTGASLTVSNKSYKDVFKTVNEIGGLVIYPHCNSNNGLFQERGKTDRTHLADHFNTQKVNILQSRHKTAADVTTDYIKTNNNLTSDHVFTLGSDSRCLKDVFAPDEMGNFCWIKAEPTFEGLKQIIYEPKARIFIGEGMPKKPINTIDSITLKLSTEAKVGEDKFCFAGSGGTYSLSPYFNCFIGGRGSGKSTILNFLGLHSNNPDSPKKFWDNLSPSFDPNGNGIFSFGGTEIFEFLAQSEIETFARDKSKFTQAIYDRANSRAGNILEEYENGIESRQGKLTQIIQAVSDLKILEDQKIAKEKEKRTLESSVKVLSSKEYNEVITGITEKSKELQNLEDWKKNISGLKNSLTELIPESESEDPEEKIEKTEYEKAYVLAITKIGEAIELLKEDKFTQEATKVSEIKEALIDLESKAKTLIEKAGYTPESVEQIKSAPQMITNLESEIKNLAGQIEVKTKVIATFDNVVSELRTDKQNYESKITEILKPLQDQLKKQYEYNQGKDIKQISLEYSFDETGAWVALAEDFYNHFYQKYHDTERSKEVCEFITANKQVFSKNTFDDVKRIVKESQKSDKKYTKFLDEVFKDEKNFLVFQAIRDNHFYDVKLNKIIQVKYDNRDVEQASFGQRCTAVVVILLLFGNYPLIIDEPEAHLDSSLIANYLVPLLKEKKSDRQIIFATHNANFVINGDAEKIFILRNESGQTEVIETTIEDIANREELLKLEGGKEAFEKRGKKLDIK